MQIKMKTIATTAIGTPTAMPMVEPLLLFPAQTKKTPWQHFICTKIIKKNPNS